MAQHVPLIVLILQSGQADVIWTPFECECETEEQWIVTNVNE